MAESTIPRRISEFVGVALFAVGLIWLIALVTHEPLDPVWFFTTDAAYPPANFIGRVGAFLSEVSLQLFGYASYLLPVLIAAVGWHYFWCRQPDAAYTKVVGVALFFGCASTFLSLIFGTSQLDGKTFYAGGLIGTWLGAAMSEYLNRTGSIIVLLTLIALSAILSTQFSFGRLFAQASRESRGLWVRSVGALRVKIERFRKERERRKVTAKHAKKAALAARAADAKAGTPAASEAKPQVPASPPVVARKPIAVEPSLPLTMAHACDANRSSSSTCSAPPTSESVGEFSAT